jgi:hypothetical protein
LRGLAAIGRVVDAAVAVRPALAKCFDTGGSFRGVCGPSRRGSDAVSTGRQLAQPALSLLHECHAAMTDERLLLCQLGGGFAQIRMCRMTPLSGISLRSGLSGRPWREAAGWSAVVVAVPVADPLSGVVLESALTVIVVA